ncbi:hypothetical protein H310_04571 [Aphanomyces invadans]|uniref:Uncharacterized protein n=1 Tax=Aphanomyces invadans TaxID=157072 RepID=A0A024UCT5_9STRA|nr:hypothetical protein H310_04571 [Aphanomyces invadans]ETW04236.1 hypothetical protein H310_04571 [Aphanomyces invadans]|eukprot:XP_008867192.1 hypothetical protein H310_04571 [Aphanomyces invadans]
MASSPLRPKESTPRRVAMSSHPWPRRNYTKPWLTNTSGGASRPDPIEACPTPPPLPASTNFDSMPGWDSSPPQVSRILVHQILAKSHPADKQWKGDAPSPLHHAPKTHPLVDAKAFIMDLRREIDWRLACDVVPIQVEDETQDRRTSVATHDGKSIRSPCIFE